MADRRLRRRGVGGAVKRLWAGTFVALIGWIAAGVASADPPRGQAPSPLSRRLNAEFRAGLPQDDLLFILAIGSDARIGQAVAGARADSIHIIGVNPRREKASVLGIPRDSFVPIPGAGTSKINASLVLGGPELTVATVERLTRIRIDGYVLAGFDDFRRMATKVGQIEIRIPYPMSDPFSKAYFRAGPTRLNGDEALAFSRNRHDARGGDFGRSMNQGRLIVAALRAFGEDVRRDPLALFRWAAVGFEHLISDLSLLEMLQLLQAALSIDPAAVDNRVVSGSGGSVGGASVIHLGSFAHGMFRDLRQDGLL
jgi:LCP family protein required for cell wall assembly